VTSKGVFLSTLGYTDPHPSSGSPWTVAVVGDLNDNGLPDIIAGSSKALNLEFLNNAGGGVFNPSILPTEGPPAYLAIGDFDGDLVNDVAFSQEFDMAGEARDLGAI